MRKVPGTFSGFVLLLALCACAAPRVEPPETGLAAAERARSAIAAGQTKSDVLAALGKAQVISFDSGYEVWVYRFAKTEFIVLFSPAGLVTKQRLRPPA